MTPGMFFLTVCTPSHITAMLRIGYGNQQGYLNKTLNLESAEESWTSASACYFSHKDVIFHFTLF